MIANLTPSPAYRDSGVEWLGEEPGHWGWRRCVISPRSSVQEAHPVVEQPSTYREAFRF